MTPLGTVQTLGKRSSSCKTNLLACDGDVVGLASGLLGTHKYVRGATGVKVLELDAVMSGIYAVLVCSSATWYHSCASLHVCLVCGLNSLIATPLQELQQGTRLLLGGRWW